MLEEKMRSFIAGSIGVTGIVVLVIALLCVMPAILIWAINTIAAIGGSGFYIPHSLWSYFVVLVLLVIIKVD